MHTGRLDDVIAPAGSGGSRRFRVSCAGRAEAAALPEDDGTGFGVEHCRIRFCPAST
ncbi:hypothetical protein GCM10015535_60920 [Streptomyces gelaticus]|uniref:Uncharacterized protein n=1 Tax=Streptomyces gelaticus TaxID=285446 RepID=A0ABQ2W9T1_9ACTN|nr:hypothetical protein GCM10015535_60920 [Streptomyces gelaticus]